MNWFWKSLNNTRALRKGLVFGLFMAPPVGAIAGLAAVFLTRSASLSIAAAVVVGLLFYVFCVRYILVNEKNRGDVWEQKQANQWIAAGRTPDEIKRRQGVWDKQGWSGVALVLAASAPAVYGSEGPSDASSVHLANIDGTPMFNGLDAHGNPYGVTYNPSSDTLVGDSGQYDSPFDDKY